MGLGLQTIPYVLPSQTYVAGQRSIQTLRDLPKQYLGRLCHLVKFLFAISMTPTYSGTPTVQGMNNLFTSVDWWDGSYMRFQGGFNHMRAKERMQTGRLRFPDADTSITSTNPRYFRHVLHAGPPQLAGSPSDFVIPTGYLENGELRFTHGALSDLKGTVSACTGTVRIIAALALFDEIRIPPAYQFINQSINAADVNLSGRAIYESLALFNSGNFDSFSAGAIGNLRVDLGGGDVVPSVKGADRTADFLDDFASGEFATVNGDPENATFDVAGKKVDHSSPTAIAAADQDLQIALYSPQDCRITKMWLAESVVRMRWDGTSTAAVALVSRILPQPDTVVATAIAKALGRLNLVQKGVKIKTLSKKLYTGPLKEFLPWAVEV